jgi:hypothetical protein
MLYTKGSARTPFNTTDTMLCDPCSEQKIAQFYAPQTKILEGGTKDEIRIFDGLFNGTWPKLSTHALQKCFDNHHFLFCSSFQNLRLGGVNFAPTT